MMHTNTSMPRITITTFGTLHGKPPTVADPERVVVVDLTHALRNPFDDPAMRELTGFHDVVFNHVMTTPGAKNIVDKAVDEVLALLAVDESGPIDVLSFCKGGRHRSVSVARSIQARLSGLGIAAEALHLDVNKPVVVSDAVPEGYRGDVPASPAAAVEEETEVEKEPETARLTADAIVFGMGGDEVLRVLAIRRRWEPFTGCWAVPGGHLDPGEEEEAACRRELEEETGLKVGGLVRTGVYAAPGRDPRGRYVTFAFAARVAGLPEAVPADDADEAAWLPVEQVVSGRIPMAFDHRGLVREAVHVGLRRN